MSTPAAGAIGSLEYPAAERRRLAALSGAWRCELCDATNVELLPDKDENSSIIQQSSPSTAEHASASTTVNAVTPATTSIENDAKNVVVDSSSNANAAAAQSEDVKSDESQSNSSPSTEFGLRHRSAATSAASSSSSESPTTTDNNDVASRSPATAVDDVTATANSIRPQSRVAPVDRGAIVVVVVFSSYC